MRASRGSARPLSARLRRSKTPSAIPSCRLAGCRRRARRGSIVWSRENARALPSRVVFVEIRELIYDCELRERRAGAQEQAHDSPTIEMAPGPRGRENHELPWTSGEVPEEVDISDISMCIEEECDHIDAGITNATGCIMQRRPILLLRRFRVRSPVKERAG